MKTTVAAATPGEKKDEEEMMMMTIEEKVQHKIDVEVQTELLDRIYTKTRQHIREHKGMITHENAMNKGLKEDLEKIKEEMLTAQLEHFAKTDPLLVEKFRSNGAKDREEAMHMLDAMIEEMRSPD